MNENKKYSSLPDGLSSIADDEAITEIDLGDFLIENSKSDTLFEGFREDIERTEKSLESDLQSLYDDIMGSGPETIVPKPLSMLTESEAEPKKVVLSDPEPLPESENSSLENIWMDPEDYFDADIPVVSLDDEGAPQEAEASEPAEQEAGEITSDDAKAGIFSMIDMLKKDADDETGFDDIISEIELNPEIAPVDTDLSEASRLVSMSDEAQYEDEEELELNEEDFEWEELPSEDVTEETESEINVKIEADNEEKIESEINVAIDAEIDEEITEIDAEIKAETDKDADAKIDAELDFVVEEATVPSEAQDTLVIEENIGAEDTESDDFEKELAVLLGDADEEPETKKEFVITVPDDGNDYERAAAVPEKLYQASPMSTATLQDDPELIEEDEKKNKKKKKAKKEKADGQEKKGGAGEIVRKIILAVSAVTIVVCSGMLANVYVIEPYRFKTEAEKIASEMNVNINTHSDTAVVDTENTASEIDYPEGMLAKYASLYAVNDDLRGWISIPGFEINLPIAQGPNNSHYLKKDIYGKYTRYGVPYFDYRITDFENLHRNTVVYGHNMRHDDLIFGMLENYRTIEGFRQAPVIECNTIYGDHSWFVYAVFISNAFKEDDNGYVLPYNFIDLDDGNFLKYLEEIDARKLYTTGVDINLTDKILTLSTCAYDFDDARLVVVARQRREGESVAVDTSKAYKNDDPKYPQAWYDAYGKDNSHAYDPRW